MINGVIFDMDGTMFDTERMWATFWDPALKALGLPYKEGPGRGRPGHGGQRPPATWCGAFTARTGDADGIVESLHRVADEVFLSAPVPKKPGWTPCWPGWTSSASPWPWLPPAGRP